MNHPEPSRVLTSETGLLTGDVTIRPAEAEEEERNQEHIKTDHLLPDLKRRTISGGVVTVSAQAAKFALNLVSTVILARLLTPRDFGLGGNGDGSHGIPGYVSACGLGYTHCATRTHHARPGVQSVLDKSRRKRLVRAYSSRFVAGYSLVLPRFSNNIRSRCFFRPPS